MPCSCYNSSATNDSAVFDMISLPQFSRLGPPARPRQNTDFCVVPANSYIYREVGRVWSRRGRSAWMGVTPREAGPQNIRNLQVGWATRITVQGRSPVEGAVSERRAGPKEKAWLKGQHLVGLYGAKGRD